MDSYIRNWFTLPIDKIFLFLTLHILALGRVGWNLTWDNISSLPLLSTVNFLMDGCRNSPNLIRWSLLQIIRGLWFLVQEFLSSARCSKIVKGTLEVKYFWRSFMASTQSWLPYEPCSRNIFVHPEKHIKIVKNQ